MAICAHCSTPVADEAKFCHSCGSLVSDAEGQAAATANMDRSSFDHMEKLLREETKGDYTIGHMLGKGGMAVVYLATETSLSRKVALKVLPPELTFGHGVERFKREAKTAAALDHPHIIPIYRISNSQKLFWYAMKYLEGRSLEDLLRERGAFSVDETLEVLTQVAEALDYAHEHKVIHRDIKPANVMLDNRNRVILTDFGIAKALSEGKLTATDSVIGTPYFMSPEQGMGKTVTGASDQYSVAVMAYRMLAGHVPFDGDSAIDILHKHCMFPPPSLAEAAPHLPDHVVHAVERALSKGGAERFQSVSDFVKAMKDASFEEKQPTRSSVATVMVSPEDAKKIRSGVASKGAGSTGPAAKTVAAKPGATPAARPKPGAPVAVAPAPAPAKSKAGLIAVAALVIVAGGGFGAWKILSAPDAATSPSTLAPIGGTPTPPAGTAAGTGTESQTPPPIVVADAGTKTPDPLPTAAAPAPKAPTKSTPPPRVAKNNPPPATTTTQQPVQQQPVQQPVTAPTTVPAPTPTAPPPAGGLGDRGIVRVRINPAATVYLNLESKGEKATYIDTLRAGIHSLKFEKDGYVTNEQNVTLAAGETKTLRVDLVKKP